MTKPMTRGYSIILTHSPCDEAYVDRKGCSFICDQFVLKELGRKKQYPRKIKFTARPIYPPKIPRFDFGKTRNTRNVNSIAHDNWNDQYYVMFNQLVEWLRDRKLNSFNIKIEIVNRRRALKENIG